MKNIHTAPLEVLSSRPNGSFSTEPHEAGWADEALLIAYVREAFGPSPKIELRAEISADGSRWINHASPVLSLDGAASGTIALTHFGNWLRFSGEVSGGPDDASTAIVIDLYLVMKG